MTTLASLLLPEMTDFQTTMPVFPADMCDSIDPSNLVPYHLPDNEWLTKDHFEILSWDFVGTDQTLNTFAESASLAEVQPRSSYTRSNDGAPREWGDYMIKTNDTFSEASLSVWC